MKKQYHYFFGRSIARSMLIFSLAVISFCLFLVTITNTLAFFTHLNSIKGMFQSSLSNVYRVDVSYIEDMDRAGYFINKFKSQLNMTDHISCGAYDLSGEYFVELEENENLIELNKLAYAGTFRQEAPSIVEVVFYDDSMAAITALPFAELHTNDESQSTQDYLPLYVGSDFQSVLAIGDTLTLARNGTKYMVKGFLEKKMWFNDSDPITMPTEYLDHRFLAPFSADDRTNNITQQSTVGKIFVNGPTNLKATIEKIAIENGIKARATNLNDFISNWQEENRELLKTNQLIAGIVIFGSVISMISTLASTVLLDDRL